MVCMVCLEPEEAGGLGKTLFFCCVCGCSCGSALHSILIYVTVITVSGRVVFYLHFGGVPS